MKPEKSHNQPTEDTFDTPIPFVSSDNQKVVNPRIVDEVIKEAVTHISAGMRSAKKGLLSILIGALHLNWLRLQHSAKGARNDLVSNDNKSGFAEVLGQLSIAAPTAYRWIGRTRVILTEIGVSDTNFPSPGTNEWTRMEKYIKEHVERLESLNLPIRAITIPMDEEIMTRLRTAAVSGDQIARQLLSQLESGEITIKDATRFYAKVEKSSDKTPPSMLKLNPKTLQPEGQMMNALKTLESGLRNWDQYPNEVRIQAKQRIQEVLAQLPEECKFHWI